MEDVCQELRDDLLLLSAGYCSKRFLFYMFVSNDCGFAVGNVTFDATIFFPRLFCANMMT
jgi:hypothetical protein